MNEIFTHEFEPIENYGVIGNMRSIALVGMNGSIDFLAIRVSIRPLYLPLCSMTSGAAAFRFNQNSTTRRVRQLYLPDTNILLTRFLAEEGVAEVTDFMPISAVSRAAE